jgi:hypothetical protein
LISIPPIASIEKFDIITLENILGVIQTRLLRVKALEIFVLALARFRERLVFTCLQVHNDTNLHFKIIVPIRSVCAEELGLLVGCGGRIVGHGRSEFSVNGNSKNRTNRDRTPPVALWS